MRLPRRGREGEGGRGKGLSDGWGNENDSKTRRRLPGNVVEAGMGALEGTMPVNMKRFDQDAMEEAHQIGKVTWRTP